MNLMSFHRMPYLLATPAIRGGEVTLQKQASQQTSRCPRFSIRKDPTTVPRTITATVTSSE